MADIHIKAGESIQAAIGKAAAGDTLVLAPGTYREKLVINKRVTIVGDGATLDGGYLPTLFDDAAGYTDWNGKPVKPGELPAPTAANIKKGKWLVNSGKYAPLVAVTANGATIRGLTIRNVAGRGISVNAADDVTIEDCVIDFTYANPIQAQGCKRLTIRGNRITRGSAKRWDSSHGAPIVDSCVFGKDCTNTLIEDNVLAWCWGEGINTGRGSNGVVIRGNVAHTCYHDPFYFGSATNVEVIGNVAYSCDGLKDEIGGGGQNVTGIVDEEYIQKAGQLYRVEGNLFISPPGRAFYTGSGNPTQSDGGKSWSRPAVLAAGCLFAGNTFIGRGDGAVNGVVLWGEDKWHRHGAGEVRDNLILLNPAATGALVVSQGWAAFDFHHNTYNRAAPHTGASDTVLPPGAGVLRNPYAPITCAFKRNQPDIPDPTATTFDLDNYMPLPDSSAAGRASDGRHPGALQGASEPPPPDPEPEPPAWAAPLAALSARLQALEAAKFSVYGALDALDNELADTGEAFVDLVNALGGEGGDPGAD